MLHAWATSTAQTLRAASVMRDVPDRGVNSSRNRVHACTLEEELGEVDLGEKGGRVGTERSGAGRLAQAVEPGDVDAVSLAVLVDPHRRVLLHRLCGLEVGGVEFGAEALQVRRDP